MMCYAYNENDDVEYEKNSNFDKAILKNLTFLTCCLLKPRHYFILLSKRFHSLSNLQAVFDGWNVVLKSLFRVDMLRE